MSYEDDEANERFEQWLDHCEERARQDFLETMPALMAMADAPPVLMPNEVALYGYDGECTVVEVTDPAAPPMTIVVPLTAGPSSYVALSDEDAGRDPLLACYERVGGRVYRRVS